jgi:hypothetical protein
VQHVVVRWLDGALDALVRVEVKVKAAGEGDAGVDAGARADVAGAVVGGVVRGEEASTVALEDGNVRDGRRVAWLEVEACLTDRRVLLGEYLQLSPR